MVDYSPGHTPPPEVTHPADGKVPAQAKPTSPPKPVPAMSAADKSAKGTITTFLRSIGLDSLGQYVWDQYKQSGSVDLALLAMKDTTQYETRFAPRLALQAAGFQMTEAEQLSYEDNAMNLMRAAGMPKGFYDHPSDFADIIASGTSLSELGERINGAFAQVQKEPQVVRDAMSEYYGGKGDHALAAMALDTNKALPVIQAHVAAAEAGGYLAQQNVQIGRTLAERIATATGNSQQAIIAGAAQIGKLGATGILDPRFNEHGVSVETAADATFAGNGEAAADVQREIDTRVASTAGGESFDISRLGAAGLGQAGGR